MTILLYHQWQFLYQRCNWIDFTVIRLCWEKDTMFGNFEIIFEVLGVGFVVRWHYADTDKGRQLAEQIADFDTQHKEPS